MGERLVQEGLPGDDPARPYAVSKRPLDEPPLFGFLQRVACPECGHVCGAGGCTCWWCFCCLNDCCCRHKKPEAR